jgi:hypothetical protein
MPLWLKIMLPLFLIIFFGFIIRAGLHYSDYKEQMQKQCAEAGGEVYINSKGKGWPDVLCLEKGAILLRGKNLDDDN